MHDGNRRSDFAIGGIAAAALAAFAVFGWLSYREYEREHREEREAAAAYQADHGAQQGETLCVEIAHSRTRACVSQPPEAGGDTKQSEYDLRAQQDMAQWAYAMFLATVAGLFVTAVGLVYVVRAFRLNAEATKAATDQAETARTHLERMETPFLRVVADPKPDDAQSWDWIEDTLVRFENCGRSYAIITHCTVAIQPMWEIEARGFFKPELGVGRDVGRGTIVPAGEKSLPFSCSKPEIKEDRERMEGEGGFVHGICRFEDALGNGWVMGFALLFVPIHGEYFVLGQYKDRHGNSGNFHRAEEKPAA